MIFGWVNNTNHILSHLVPQGTPNALIIFIVIIELVRNLIRPVTLCVRLTANLIAGHLLITLLGNFIIRINVTLIPVIILAPIVLTTLESAVAFIQSYVFVTLITLYRSETKYWKTNLILFT
jgi:F-type H+-transporting ATPase subunit a